MGYAYRFTSSLYMDRVASISCRQWLYFCEIVSGAILTSWNELNIGTWDETLIESIDFSKWNSW